MDENLSNLQKTAASSKLGSILESRSALKNSGGDSSLDLSLPHSWKVKEGMTGECDFGSVQNSLRNLCRDDCLQPFIRGVSRPLTVRESIIARLDQFGETGESGNLWYNWLSSCSAIVYKANSTKFKIVPISDHLLSVPDNFNHTFLSVDYDKIQGVELDSAKGVYGLNLKEEDVVKHEGWLATLEGDKKLLERYAKVIFGSLGRRGMCFNLVKNPKQDLLLALCIGFNTISYTLGGGRMLNVSTRLARVSAQNL